MAWLVVYVGAAVALVVVACAGFAIRLLRREPSAERRLAMAWWAVPCLWASAVAFWSMGFLMVPWFVAFGLGFILLALGAIVAAAVAAVLSDRRTQSVVSALVVTPLPIAALALLLWAGARFG